MSKPQEINATIIADSKNEFGQRITSWVLTYPRMIHAEMMTHRVFSRNAASSRAIPFKKMVQKVQEDPFVPIAWQKDHSGMQGEEYLTGRDEFDIPAPEGIRMIDSGASEKLPGPQAAEHLWLRARDYAVEQATFLNETTGVTKQLCNRLLEPFLWYTAIFTGTEWENFFALRAHKAAEIHIADLAEKMLKEYNRSEAAQLKAGEWHIPFGDRFDIDRLNNMMQFAPSGTIENMMVKIATARCARVSYENFDGKDDYEADIKLHDRLASMGHWSPFEHCARAMTQEEYDTHFSGILGLDGDGYYRNPKDEQKYLGWSGNFQGFIQYRKMFPEENKKDPRVN